MDRNIVVTGAAGGIGLAVTERFLQEGDAVLAVAHRNLQTLSELEKRLREESGEEAVKRFHVICADLSTAEGAETVVSEADRLFTRVDVLVNNAGMCFDTLFQESSEERYQRILNTNLSSAVRLSKAFLPGMIRNQSGRVVNVSSLFGSVGISMEVEYSVTKGGIDALTRSLAKEVAPSGITVNAVAPGLIDTPMNKDYTKEEIEELLTEIPKGRFGRPEEVADLVHYLSVSPDYLTGQVIRIDGGWM